MSLHNYIVDIFQETNKMDENTCDTLFPVGSKVSKEDGNPLDKLGKYRRHVGRLVYLTITRLDVTFSIQ